MKKALLAVCLVLMLASNALAQNLKARIKIDIERATGEIDRLLYGNFTEHLGQRIPLHR